MNAVPGTRAASDGRARRSPEGAAGSSVARKLRSRMPTPTATSSPRIHQDSRTGTFTPLTSRPAVGPRISASPTRNRVSLTGMLGRDHRSRARLIAAPLAVGLGSAPQQRQRLLSSPDRSGTSSQRGNSGTARHCTVAQQSNCPSLRDTVPDHPGALSPPGRAVASSLPCWPPKSAVRVPLFSTTNGRQLGPYWPRSWPHAPRYRLSKTRDRDTIPRENQRL